MKKSIILMFIIFLFNGSIAAENIPAPTKLQSKEEEKSQTSKEYNKESFDSHLKAHKEELLNAEKESIATSKRPPWTPTLVTYLSIYILTFTSLVLILSTILLWRSNSGSLEILKIFGTITTLGLSAFLLVIGYSNEQLTPIIGLFGAIAGYLLGKDSKPPNMPSP